MTLIQGLSWIAVAAGLVVALVVTLLLQLLLNAVNRIERDVIELWQTATSVARNTATSWQLDETAEALDGIKAEAGRHDALLSGTVPRSVGDGTPPTELGKEQGKEQGR